METLFLVKEQADKAQEDLAAEREERLFEWPEYDNLELRGELAEARERYRRQKIEHEIELEDMEANIASLQEGEAAQDAEYWKVSIPPQHPEAGSGMILDVRAPATVLTRFHPERSSRPRSRERSPRESGGCPPGRAVRRA